MISLKNNRSALVNLPVTIKALEDLEILISYYSKDVPGPAYVIFDCIDGPNQIRTQMNRKIMVAALQSQKQQLKEYLFSLGIAE